MSKPAPWWQPVLLLSLCWMMSFSVLTACAASANLAGAALNSGDPGLNTLPLAITTFTTGVYNAAMPWLFGKLGRWRAYLMGALVGCAGGLVAWGACEVGSLGLLCFGTFLMGVGLCHSQNYRFGVQLCVPEGRKEVAISWVLAGGVAGAILGPEYSKHARNMLPTPFGGIFIVCAAMFVANFLLLLAGKQLLAPLAAQPASAAAAAAAGAAAPAKALRRPLCRVWTRPRCLSSTVVMTCAYGLMVFLMGALPLAMASGAGFSFVEAAVTIQIHMVCMFAPSFITGHAVKRFGAPAIELVGAILIAAGGGPAFVGVTYADFTAAQAVVALGWNLCFVASTAALSQQARPSEKVVVQALNDSIVFCLSGVASVLAGVALPGIGWQPMQIFAFATAGVIVLSVVLSEVLARRAGDGHLEGSPVGITASDGGEAKGDGVLGGAQSVRALPGRFREGSGKGDGVLGGAQSTSTADEVHEPSSEPQAATAEVVLEEKAMEKA